MTSRNTSGVVVRDILMVVADRLDDISFHDLHMVDVIKQLYVRRVNALDYFYAKGGVVAPVIWVVATAI